MAIKEPEYLKNCMIVKSLGIADNQKLKVIFMRRCRNAGVEAPKRISECVLKDDELRLDESITRSKRMIYEYAACNKFDFFFTGTLDPVKYDRYDRETFHSDLTQWIRNLNRNHSCDISFLFVPEQHKDGAWHVHGLLSGIPANMLHQFRIGDDMGKAIADKVIAGQSVYTWLQYSKKFGFCSLMPVKNQEAVSKYIVKYITKEIVSAVPKGKQSFWHSKDLKCAMVIMKGQISELPFKPDYSGDYASVTTFEDTPVMRASLESLYLHTIGVLNDC